MRALRSLKLLPQVIDYGSKTVDFLNNYLSSLICEIKTLRHIFNNLLKRLYLN